MTNTTFVIFGKKQAGKSTTGNIIAGCFLKMTGQIEDFRIDEEGDLHCRTGRSPFRYLPSGQFNAAGFRNIKTFSFADEIKRFCVEVLNLEPSSCYGTNAQKRLPTHLRWEDMPTPTGKTGSMSGREVMQYFGTEIIRKMYPNAWVDNTDRRVRQFCTRDTERPNVCIITDGRLPNEKESSDANGAIEILLLRDVCEPDGHVSEQSLKMLGGREPDLTLDNQNMSVGQLVEAITTFCTPILARLLETH